MDFGWLQKGQYNNVVILHSTKLSRVGISSQSICHIDTFNFGEMSRCQILSKGHFGFRKVILGPCASQVVDLIENILLFMSPQQGISNRFCFGIGVPNIIWTRYFGIRSCE